MSERDVARVLAGEASYDDLTDSDQAIVRAAWTQKSAQLRESLDFALELEAAGESWTEADEVGRPVTHTADSSPSEVLRDRG